MKKFTLFAIILIFFSFVIIIVASYNEEILNVQFVENINSKANEKLKVCVLNSNNQFVLIDVKKHTDEDIYLYILKSYDHYRNNLPLTYKTPLNGNFEVVKIIKDKDVLNIDLKMMYLDSGLNDFLNALIWSYSDFGINSLNVNINDNVFYINNKPNINVIIEAEDFYNNYKQVIYYENEFEIIPVTYFHKENKVDFLMNKIIKKLPNISYNFNVLDDFLYLNITDTHQFITEEIVSNLIKNLEEINEFKNIVIVINEVEVYNN